MRQGRGRHGFLLVAIPQCVARERVYFCSTCARDKSLYNRLRRLAGHCWSRAVFFLLKSLACIALVLFALGWRGVEAPEKPSRAAASRGERRPSAGENLAQAGTDALIAAARDKCLAAPRDCAALLQRLPVAGRER
jgi:hypothetical protein